MQDYGLDSVEKKLEMWFDQKNSLTQLTTSTCGVLQRILNLAHISSKNLSDSHDEKRANLPNRYSALC